MYELQIALGVIETRGRYLLSRRRADAHEGNRWEFPGGKLEPGESPAQALARELFEELGIEALDSEPLIEIPYRYPRLNVRLHVRRVRILRGTAHGREGQPLRWFALSELWALSMPAANRGILAAIALPEQYLITPEPQRERAIFLSQLEARLAAGMRLVQLRSKRLPDESLLTLARQAVSLCERYDARLLLNASPELAIAAGAHGVHLSSARLAALSVRQHRSLPASLLVGASCHDAGQLAEAQALKVDYVLCSPVRATPSHPGVPGMGWQVFAKLCAQSAVPVYALGGVGPEDQARIRAAGGQGAAGITAYWSR